MNHIFNVDNPLEPGRLSNAADVSVAFELEVLGIKCRMNIIMNLYLSLQFVALKVMFRTLKIILVFRRLPVKRNVFINMY